MVLRKVEIRPVSKDFPESAFTTVRYATFKCGQPGIGIRPVPVVMDQLNKRDLALCENATHIRTVAYSGLDPARDGTDDTQPHDTREVVTDVPSVRAQPERPADKDEEEDDFAPAAVFLCASCGNVPGNQRCSNMHCQRWYCTRPAGVKVGAIGCVSEQPGPFTCPACTSGEQRYKYFGSHPRLFVQDDDLAPVVLISILRPNATGYGPNELTARLERRFSGINDGRFARVHMYLGSATKALCPAPATFGATIRKHMLNFPNSRVVFLVEAHSDIATGTFGVGKGEFFPWEYLKEIIGEATLPGLIASRGRKILTLLTCGAAFTVEDSFKSLEKLLEGGVADVILGAAGPAFVPGYCVGPLVEITYRCVMKPGISTDVHAAAVFASDTTMVKRNVPIYLERVDDGTRAETLHVNDRFTAWGFRLSECPICHNFDNVKSGYPNGGVKEKAAKAKRRGEVKISFPLRLTCTAHKDDSSKPPSTKKKDMPKGVRPASNDGGLVWHPFQKRKALKWVWEGYEEVASDSEDGNV